MRKVFFLLLILLLGQPLRDVIAQKQAPPPSLGTQEVIERLTRLEEGQKALSQRIDDVQKTLSQRIDDVQKTLSQRIDDVNSSLNKRIDDLRLEMNSRLNDLMTLSQIILSTLVALVLAIAGAGFVMWRKILTVDAAVQTKIGLDQAVREQVLHLEQEVGFVKGKLQELNETLGRR